MMGRAATRRSLLGALLVTCGLAGCSFDGGGVATSDGNGPDTDGDGISDATDNCPEDANPSQENEDGDALGNVCDNCPSVENDDQANEGEIVARAAPDGAGDACDPDPAGPGNDILLFEGFDSAAVLTDWRVFSGGTWAVSGGALRQTTSSLASPTVYLGTEQFAGSVIETSAEIDTLPTSPGAHGVAVLQAFASGPSLGAGYECALSADAASDGTDFDLVTLRGSQAPQNKATATLAGALDAGSAHVVTLSNAPETNELRCTLAASSLGAATTLQATDDTYSGGFIGLRTQLTAAHFDYVVVYANP